MLNNHAYHLTEAQRRLSQTLSAGVISAVDAGTASVKVVVNDDEPETDWIPFMAPRVGTVTVWSLPSVGSTCLLLCPEGEWAQAVALPALAESAGTATEHFVRFPDGTQLHYNEATKALRIESAGTLTLESTGATTVMAPSATVQAASISLQGTSIELDAANVSVTGNLSIAANLTVTGSSSMDGINFNNHTHPGDSGGTTGPPQ